MTLSKQKFTQYIEAHDFAKLFINGLGWNNDSQTISLTAQKTENFTLKSIADKQGFKILVCTPDAQGKIPPYSTRREIQSKVIFAEHIIIYTNQAKTEQIWQVPLKQVGKPKRIIETSHRKGQAPELLYQRASGILFHLDEEDNITIMDVTQRVAQNFQANTEKVTKKFYERFKKEHTAFMAFISGIDDHAKNKDWYASLMLNRLMFCYFIQKKGFLDNNKNYLTHKLASLQERKGKDKFYSFYRNFLLRLFHEGLGAPQHDQELQAEIGKIPYLNGGLFDKHEIENKYPHIEIADEAFARIFAFFDEFEWHLDTRANATGKDINPDVIGYIFEKYINDRAQMGAYYTKEDITDYIAKNCIIPFLFDQTARNLKKNDLNDLIKNTLQPTGDTYLYDAVKYGINPQDIWGDLPAEITTGLNPEQKNLSDIRKPWNKPAPEDIALPTEIWRELIDRRKRYQDITTKIQAGELQTINDFITYNLNIRQFTQDLLEKTEDAKFIEKFYEALQSVTILDPTCGSGAFLFAAMNILEPLYEACLLRMRTFTEDEDRANLEQKDKNKFSNKFTEFRKILAQTQNEQHPNLAYFIYKSIILRNLHGVDIMHEATEIAKLRLFLKLIATVEPEPKKPNYGLEPLPDIDFNIRAGNALVGFGTQQELEHGLAYTLEGVIAAPKITEKCEQVAGAYKHYKTIQLEHGEDYSSFKNAKDELNKRLHELNQELNQLLHKQHTAIKYPQWLENYQPFHWFAEFYDIIQEKGGFDVIIGNPPYVVYSAQNSTYRLQNYETLACGNLYAYCSERSFKIMQYQGRFGMIIPNSSISADKMYPIQKIFVKDKTSWISNYAWRPSKLFEGANMLLAIVLSINSDEKLIHTSIYYKWYNEFRDSLFQTISYNNATKILLKGTIPKIPSNIYYSIVQKLEKKSLNKQVNNFFTNQITKYKLYANNGLKYPKK